MSALRKDELLQKMLTARIALQNYLQLRNAKGYMSVKESAGLRDALFSLCNELRLGFAELQDELSHEELQAFMDGTGALSSAALCLMSGKRHCSLYIAVNAARLEQQLNQVQRATDMLAEKHHPTEA